MIVLWNSHNTGAIYELSLTHQLLHHLWKWEFFLPWQNSFGKTRYLFLGCLGVNTKYSKQFCTLPVFLTDNQLFDTKISWCANYGSQIHWILKKKEKTDVWSLVYSLSMESKFALELMNFLPFKPFFQNHRTFLPLRGASSSNEL